MKTDCEADGSSAALVLGGDGEVGGVCSRGPGVRQLRVLGRGVLHLLPEHGEVRRHAVSVVVAAAQLRQLCKHCMYFVFHKYNSSQESGLDIVWIDYPSLPFILQNDDFDTRFVSNSVLLMREK